jgi:hypothetical protein
VITEREYAQSEFFCSLKAYERAHEESPIVKPLLPADVDLETELAEIFHRMVE